MRDTVRDPLPTHVVDALRGLPHVDAGHTTFATRKVVAR
jgi:hypothetical protein